MTAPLAIIQINSVTVGKMKNVRITEQIRRGRVTGLGSLTPSELPALEWSGSLTCSSYTINFNLLANVAKKGTFRNANSLEEWANAILLQEDGLEISILRKVKDGAINTETGLVSMKPSQRSLEHSLPEKVLIFRKVRFQVEIPNLSTLLQFCTIAH